MAAAGRLQKEYRQFFYRGLLLYLIVVFGLVDCRPRSTQNLLWIVIDALRYDSLACYGQKRYSTPAISSLADRGVVFEKAYCAYPKTLPSIASMFTSTYPIRHRIKENDQILPDSLETIAEILRGRGFKTAAFVSNWVLRNESLIGRGFEEYDDRLPQKEENREIFERSGDLTAAAAVRWLTANAGKNKFFLFVHFEDPHGPYYPHPELAGAVPRYKKGVRLEFGNDQGQIPPYQVLEQRQDAGFYLSNYAGEVMYTDRQVQKVLDALSKTGQDKQTAVILTADHGEAMGEHGYYFQHGEFLHEPQIRIPLIIRIPGTKPKRAAKIAEHIDLGPTILDLFGLETPPQFQGKSLLPLMGSESGQWEQLAYSQLWRDENLALIDGRMKLVHFTGRKLLYDLGRDPGEKRNIYKKTSESQRRRLEEKLKLYELFKPKTPLVPKKLDREKTLEMLKALGYIR